MASSFPHRIIVALAAAALLVAAAPAAAAPRAATASLPAPSDPGFAGQWQLAGDGPLGIRSAWTITTGGDVTVAVVDTGARMAHRDLAPNLWTNPGEIAGNGLDDDANGFVDDVHGADVVDGDGDPGDANGHGTHVAGIIGARGDDGYGTTGVAWRVKLMIVRALGADGRGTMANLAEGIRYAVRNGARIVNLSLAGRRDDADLEAALAEADRAGVLVVAAAGNAGNDLDSAPLYPAASASSAVIAVASTDAGGNLASDSGYGRSTVDVSAPGEDIDAPASDGGFESRSGTSQAAAAVSGVLALMAAAKPAADAATLRAALLAGARPTAVPVAAGAVDAGAALRSLGAVAAPKRTRAAKARGTSRR
jgi:subtilisin family serine protease